LLDVPRNTEEIPMDWVALYCEVDDFCKAFEAVCRARMITEGERRRKRVAQLSLSEMLTIAIGFHGSGFRAFKGYYRGLMAERRREFTNLISYHRVVEWMPSLTGPLAA
jgi:hypothetical protein